MHLYIYSPKKTLFEGEADLVSLPTTNGEISVLNHHIPLVTPLQKGKVKVRKGTQFDETDHEFDIEGGVAQVNSTDVVLIVR